MKRCRNNRFKVGSGILLGVILPLLFSHCSGGRGGGDIPRPDHLESLAPPVRQQISQALDQAERDPTAENLGRLGMVYHSSAYYPEASLCYALAGQKDRSDWTWDYYQGILQQEMGNSGEVIGSFRKVLEKDPRSYLAWYYMGQEYRNLRDYEQAEEAYRQIASPGSYPPTSGSTRTDHFPPDTYARFELARIYNETGRDELAEKTLREILQGHRTFGPAYRLLGSIFYARGDSILGNRYGVRANDLMVFIPPVDTLVDHLVLLSRSELYLPKKIDEAERTFYDQWTVRLVEQALTWMPENKYILSKAINIYLWVGMHEKAAAHTGKHLAYFQEDYGELNRTGLAFFVNRIYGEAMKYLERALELRPDEILVQEELAMCSWTLGERERALGLLDDLYRKHPGDPDVLADLADILFFNFGETERAAEMLSLLRSVDPGHPKGMKVAAGIAEKEGRSREAIRLYESSFRGNPEELTTIRYLGNLLVKEQMWERAIGLFRAALDHHPNDPDLLEKLGSLLAMCPEPSLRKPGEGIEYLERAFIHMSSRPLTLLSAGRNLSLTLARTGEPRSALRTIEHTLEIARYAQITTAYRSELEEIYRTILALNN